MTTKSDPTKQGWEDSDFPILCQTCLGDNPFVRMTKQNHAKECKVCTRPFTVFRWHPGAGMRYKKTEICQTCSKLKNVCQTCLLDLEFGLPVQVRDTALAIKDDIPRSEVNREYYVQNIESQLTPADSLIDYDKKGDPAGREMLKKLARPAPYYKRNRPHICSFFVKGECKRGAECPYRHELPLDNELSHQNIKDRYYGHNDPVAKKMLRESEKQPSLKAPSDTTITSLFITGIEEDILESDLRDFFYAFGELKSIVVVYKSKCAFINYETRSAAESAAAKAFSNLIIKGYNLRANWGRARPSGPRHEQGGDATKAYEAFSSLAASGGPPPPPGSGSALYYPSQDSTMQGSRG